ncbi:glycosyltransferase family 92 protein [Desulfovibrio psychrotolerans]|uniref:glycosyltransferase family 92 protein n=1 Tax=Desulfovibrio psychrotolerans TaxID=415242 RepID=UPI00157AAF6F|nr:glycosyltransferase family 92 protein [Desulfovibrio psychrotolerans]
MKDEDKNLREWVSYHLMIGFDKIFIFDNGSVNPVRDVLCDYVSTGVVVVHDLSGSGMQLTAYASFIKEFRALVRWCAFIDVDEFIVPIQDNDIKDVLDRYENFGGLGISWKMFGSCGHMKRPDGNVVDAYKCVIGLDFHIKTIARMKCVDHVASPHHFAYREGKFCVNEHGIPVFGAKSYHTSDIIQINHYYYKSQQDYEDKMARGFVTPVAGAVGYDLNCFYRQANVTGSVDNSITRFNPLLRRYERLGHVLAGDRLREQVEATESQILKKAQHVLMEQGGEAALAYLANVSRYHDSVMIRLAMVQILAGEGRREEVLAEAGRLLARFSGDVGVCEEVYRVLAFAYRALGLPAQAQSIEMMLAHA